MYANYMSCQNWQKFIKESGIFLANFDNFSNPQ